MNSRIFGLLGAAVAAALGTACKEDPTASLAGGPAGLHLQYDYREVDVDDSVLVTAVLRDGSGTAVAGTITVTSCDNAVARIRPTSTPAPLLETSFYVVGVGFGTACVDAAGIGLTDRMNVATFPATIVASGPTTLLSGETKSYTYQYFSASGRNLTAQVPAPTWASDDPEIGVADKTAGTLRGLDFGPVGITAKGPGGAEGGVTATVGVVVSPAPFGGTVTPDPFDPGAVITITRAAGEPAFDLDTRVFLDDRVRVTDTATVLDRFTRLSADQITVRIDDVREPETVELVVSRIGANQLSLSRNITVADPAAFAGTVSPDPVYPGGTVAVDRAPSDPLFDSDTRAYFDRARGAPPRLAYLQPIVAATRTANHLDLSVSDLRAAGAVELLLTRMDAAQVARQSSFSVRAPDVFTGVLFQVSGGPAEVVTITRPAGGPAFDADTRAFFDGIETFVADVTANSIKVPVPVIERTGVVDLLMTRIDAGQVAQKASFTSTTSRFDDPFEPTNNDPLTAPVIIANGDYFVVLHGACSAGVGGTDCDDWFRIRNTGVSAATVTVNVAWFKQTPTDVDIDALLGSDPTGIVNFDCEDGCTGATSANPEAASISVPAGATYYVWLNLFDPHGAAATLARVRVSGLP